MILILGSGKSGTAAKKLLESNGYKIAIYDDNNKIDIDYNDVEYAVASPAFKSDHPVIKKLNEFNIKIISEIELSYRFFKGDRIVAVTGTNGKTTTTNLLGKMIKSPHYMAGNIGIAWAGVTQEKKMAILEVSSFQLDRIESFKPNISIITNIAPDHIDYHGNFDGYKKAKFNIFKSQTKDDCLIVSKKLFDEELNSIISNIVPRIYLFSDGLKVDNGIYLLGDKIYFSSGGNTRFIGSIENAKLVGKHNRENILSALLAVILLGEDIDYALKMLYNFTAPRHRLEEVLVVNNITFIDDSKATNVHATLAALNAICKRTILLLGGSDKGECFDDLFYRNDNIKEYVLFGETGNRLEKTLIRKNIKNYTKYHTFDSAVVHAISIAKPGDIVLLSPACASFDEFTSYAERGDYFAKKVRQLSFFLK